MFRFSINLYLAVGFAILMVSCKVRKTQVPIPTSTVSSCPPADSQYQAIQRNDVKFEWFSARISAKTDIEKQSASLSANLRIRKDSAIWMSISPALGIEVARVFITKDSLKFLNRIEGIYFTGDYAYLRELLKTEVNFKMIQSILLGNIYLHYGIGNYITDLDNELCVLSSFKKRKMKKELEVEVPEILTQEIFCSKGLDKVHLMEMKDYRPGRKFSVQYNSWQQFEGHVIPEHVLIIGSAEKSAQIEMEYSKLQINKELNLPFNIPENYVPVR